METKMEQALVLTNMRSILAWFCYWHPISLILPHIHSISPPLSRWPFLQYSSYNLSACGRDGQWVEHSACRVISCPLSHILSQYPGYLLSDTSNHQLHLKYLESVVRIRDQALLSRCIGQKQDAIFRTKSKHIQAILRASYGCVRPAAVVVPQE